MLTIEVLFNIVTSVSWFMTFSRKVSPLNRCEDYWNYAKQHFSYLVSGYKGTREGSLRQNSTSVEAVRSNVGIYNV